MNRLPPTEFTYGKYGTYIPAKNYENSRLLSKWFILNNVIGWCESIECEIRPRKDLIAIMTEDEDNYQTWCHITKEVFKLIKDYYE